MIRLDLRQCRFAAAGLDALAHKGGIDTGIDHQMGDMDILRPQFARRTLCHRAQTGLGAGESGIAHPTTQGGRGASEQNGSPPMGQHQSGCFACRQKASIARHLPHLAEDTLGRIQKRKIHIGAGIEDADFQRCGRIGLGQKGGDVVFLARIQRAAFAAPTCGFNRLFQGDQLVRRAAPGKDQIAFRGKAFGDGRPDKIAGSDYGDRCVALHVRPHKSYFKTNKS